MKTSNANSGRTSDTTSTPAPKTDDANKAADTMSESAYLTRQADEARAAISHTIDELKQRLGESVDVLGWTREYPWITLGAVAVAGFVATSAMVPSKEHQELKRLRAISDALTPSSKSESNGSDGHGKKSDKGIYQKMAEQAMRSLPGVLSAVASGIAAKVGQNPQDATGNPRTGRPPFNPS